jgi:hypothetical protein
LAIGFEAAGSGATGFLATCFLATGSGTAGFLATCFGATGCGATCFWQPVFWQLAFLDEVVPEKLA